jgi:hypothetical protein
MHRIARVVTIGLTAVMCLIALAMIIGLASFSMNFEAERLVRFLTVASLPFLWLTLVLFVGRENRGRPLIAVLSVAAFVAFLGAVDFANGRAVYSSLNLHALAIQTPR